MDRTHLRRKDGVPFVEHLLCKLRALVFDRLRIGAYAALAPLVHRRNQTADADARSAEIAYLVDLQHGIELSGLFEYLLHLIGRHSIQPAPEGKELNELQLVAPADEFGGVVEARVIHPLIHHPKRTFPIHQIVRKTVFGKNVKAVRCDHFRDAVVDLRINMIGTTGKHDTAPFCVYHFVQNACTLFADIVFCPAHFQPRLMRGGSYLPRRDIPLLLAEFHKPVRRRFFTREGDKRAQITHLPGGDRFHVVFQVFRIGRDHRAVVVVVGVRRLLIFVKHAGVEHGFHALFKKPLHVSVGELCGIAFRFGRDGIHSFFVDRPGRKRRKHGSEAELFEKGRPIGVVFIHIQHAWQPYNAARGARFGKRFVTENTAALVFEHIVSFGFCRAGGYFLFAAVAADESAAVVKGVDGKHAVVFTAAAPCRL